MKRTAIITGLIAILLTAGTFILAHNSLPTLDGEVYVEGLSAPVIIERDALGIPTIRGRNRLDVVRATGFVHAQDRFFQMDLLRRDSAGELAALVGSVAIDHDKARRLHRLRSTARLVVEKMGEREHKIAKAYMEGVNAGLETLQTRPFEYLLPGVRPQYWQMEDTILAIHAMYFQLSDHLAIRDQTLAHLRNAGMPAPMFDFLITRGTNWDAPLSGAAFDTPPVPGPSVCDIRGRKQIALNPVTQIDGEAVALESSIGSNSWAVAADRTASQQAIVADDMHLDLGVPNVWYRARFIVDNPATPGSQLDITGATLPGTPAIVVGSNGQVAWGFTNSRGDWSDRVILELDPDNANRYLTPDGFQPFMVHTETIKVSDSEDVIIKSRWTIWGPVIDGITEKAPHALRWLAHLPEATNLQLVNMENARNLNEALRIPHRIGVPPQNLQVADHHGNIAWSIIGQMPRRVGYNPRFPASWANGQIGWQGWLTDQEYPALVNPEIGRIWTANARVVDNVMLQRIGDGGYSLGARSKQIRDRLLAKKAATIEDMLAIQLDDQAFFLEPWRSLLLEVLEQGKATADHQRVSQIVHAWSGHAGVDAVGYRLVHVFRQKVHDKLLNSLLNGCSNATTPLNLTRIYQTEGPIWRLVDEQPPHLLPAEFNSWQGLFLWAADEAIQGCTPEYIENCTWGQVNQVAIRHPLSGKLGLISPLLDAHNGPLPGGMFMPRIQRGKHGASQRFAVSPGRESEGYFHMPGGQSGHPLSPFYRAGHEAWVKGESTPFLPGKVQHRLLLASF